MGVTDVATVAVDVRLQPGSCCEMALVHESAVLSCTAWLTVILPLFSYLSDSGSKAQCGGPTREPTMTTCSSRVISPLVRAQERIQGNFVGPDTDLSRWALITLDTGVCGVWRVGDLSLAWVLPRTVPFRLWVDVLLCFLTVNEESVEKELQVKGTVPSSLSGEEALSPGPHLTCSGSKTGTREPAHAREPAHTHTPQGPSFATVQTRSSFRPAATTGARSLSVSFVPGR